MTDPKRNVSKPKILVVGEGDPGSYVTVLGGIEGRGMISVSAIFYTMTRLAYGYANNDTTSLYLLRNREIWFIPVLNLDGYNFIAAGYEAKGYLTPSFKNRIAKDVEQCGEAGAGVNLLRNFGYGWNYALSLYPCQAEYPGPHPESEPETRALLNLVKNHRFDMIMNLKG